MGRGTEVFNGTSRTPAPCRQRAAEHLLDWDPCASPGNWTCHVCTHRLLTCAGLLFSMLSPQYCGCCHAVVRVLMCADHMYGVVSFPMRFDRTGTLVHALCPELRHFPDKVSAC